MFCSNSNKKQQKIIQCFQCSSHFTNFSNFHPPSSLLIDYSNPKTYQVFIIFYFMINKITQRKMSKKNPAKNRSKSKSRILQKQHPKPVFTSLFDLNLRLLMKVYYYKHLHPERIQSINCLILSKFSLYLDRRTLTT